MRVPKIGLLLLHFALGVTVVSGCASYSALATPDVHMRIVEAGTLRPVAGATVTITSDADPDVKSAATSDAFGMVHLPARDHDIWALGAPLAFPDPHPYPIGRITVAAEGYQPRAFQTNEAGGAYVNGVQPVILTPMTSPSP